MKARISTLDYSAVHLAEEFQVDGPMMEPGGGGSLPADQMLSSLRTYLKEVLR